MPIGTACPLLHYLLPPERLPRASGQPRRDYPRRCRAALWHLRNQQRRDVLMENLRITGGIAEAGGAIENAGDLVVNDCDIHGNEADQGGGIYNSGEGASL